MERRLVDSNREEVEVAAYFLMERVVEVVSAKGRFGVDTTTM